MRYREVESDVTVVGGGLAGVCAAIAAARQGARVALVQNRPVLGGNSSSEIRVWVCGATAHGAQHYARETGIMGELFVENQFRNPDGNPYYWDLLLLESVRDEPNITLFLNTDVRTVEASGPPEERRIDAVVGWMLGSETEIRFSGPVFIDCSGDGFVGFLAGAEFRTGREPQTEFGEDWAPLVPDDNTLGSTILFYTKDVGHPVKYVAPKFARDITETSIPDRRVIRTDLNGCAYWWIEWGGEKDVVHDNEEIRDELQAAIYGIWDYIKNSGRFDADNLTLEWVGSVPGKREYRRFVGDYVLTQHDVLGQTEFPDRVAFGGWSIDLHPPGGMYATESGSRHWHPDGNYHIPLRCFYSRNVRNMWMAGRTISCSHVAFGSTRVMATCAVGGEAAGTAAALALSRGWTPRELALEHSDDLRRVMVRSDASVLGVPNSDPADLALAATAAASSTHRQLAVEQPSGPWPLTAAFGMVLPVDPELDVLHLLMDAAEDTEIDIELYATGAPQNYQPSELVATRTASVTAGKGQWVPIEFGWRPEQPCNAFLAVRANSAVNLHVSEEREVGTLFFTHREPPPDERYRRQWREWKHTLHRGSVCFRIENATEAFAPSRVIGGHARPFGGPQCWISAPLSADHRPWVELRWPEPVSVAEVSLLFDDDVEEDLINLHHHFTPFEVLPSLIRDYRLLTEANGEWHPLVEVRGNRVRHRRHRPDTPISTARLRLEVEAANGADRAHLIGFRAYAD